MYLTELIQQEVEKAVRKSEKPVGVLLSGGIDSSTVAAFAGELPTFTGYYNFPECDEREYAKLAVKGEHHLIEITPEDFIEHFDNMLSQVNPFRVGPGILGQWMVARYASRHGIKTLLSGEGGDELFGGYARLLAVAGRELPQGYENYTTPPDYPDNLEDALQYDWDRLPILMQADEEVCKAWGITVKAPLLSARIVEYVMKDMPENQRIDKVLLKAAMREIVPDAILDRKDKKGFPTPFVYWAQEEPFRSFVLDRIGYLPDTKYPYARDWWYELCRAKKGETV
jgi:asparagine synthetase B (glutamine-hydrolysing)